MDKIDYAALARSRYTNQFEKDKVFDAIVQTLIEYKMKTQDLYINFAKTILDIELSTGRNLDLIGSIVGQPRVLVDFSTDKYFGFLGNPRAEPFDVGLWYSEFSAKGTDSRVLSDEEYRRIIKARIIRNKTNCNREDFIKILDLILGIDRTKAITNLLSNSNFTSPLVLGNSTATVTKGVTVNDPSQVEVVSTWVAPNLITGGETEVDGNLKPSQKEYILWRKSADLNAAYAKGQVVITFDIKVGLAGVVQVYSSNGTPDYGFSTSVNVPVANEYVRMSVTVTPSRVTANNTGQSCLEFFGTYSTGRWVAVKNVVVQQASQISTAMSFNTNVKGTKLVSGNKYTFFMKAATLNTSNTMNVTLKGPTTSVQNILTAVPVASRDPKNPSLIKVSFTSNITTNEGDLSIVSTGKLGEKFWVSEMQIVEGTVANAPAWTPSTYDLPRYTLTSTSHGNIDLNVFNYKGDLGVYFLSNFEKTGDLIPVPMGYKLAVAIS